MNRRIVPLVLLAACNRTPPETDTDGDSDTLDGLVDWRGNVVGQYVVFAGGVTGWQDCLGNVQMSVASETVSGTFRCESETSDGGCGGTFTDQPTEGPWMVEVECVGVEGGAFESPVHWQADRVDVTVTASWDVEDITYSMNAALQAAP